MPMRLAVLASIAAFAVAAVMLVLVTGNLAAAMGVHCGNNLIPFLLIGERDRMGNTALFVSQPLDAAGWTVGDALAMALFSICYIEAILLLLLHPRSPLRVATVRDGGG
jgi:hypothetical protein